MAGVLKLTSRDDQNTHYFTADKVVSWTVGGGKDDAYTVLSFVNGRTFNAQGDVSERVAKAVTGEVHKRASRGGGRR